MIAQARSIGHGKAYSEYAERKEKAVFVGAENMISNTDIIFDNPDFISELWGEFKEAGLDYVRKGKDVTRDTIVIEFSPTTNESEGWTREQWYAHAKELLEEMDKRRLKAPIWDAKKKRYKRNKDGSLTMRDIPQTKLAKSKWMAYLHKDSESGIWHLHIIISRYNMDNELNCDDEIAKRAAQAAEELNKKYGYRSAEDIHDEHAAEIRQIIDDILFNMEGEDIDVKEFQERMKAVTFVDYKGNVQNYDMQYHTDDKGKVTGWSVRRGNSTYTGTELGFQLHINPNAHQKQFYKDAVYDTLRQMNDKAFSWDKFMDLLERNHGCQIDVKRDSRGDVVNYFISRGENRPMPASQIGANITVKKIVGEWQKEQNKLQGHQSDTTQDDEKKIRRWSKEWQRLEQEKREKQEAQRIKKLDGQAKSYRNDGTNMEPTTTEKERQEAIRDARKALSDYAKNKIMYVDMKEAIINGAAAKAVENGNSPFINVNLQGAVQELMEGLSMTGGQISSVMTTVGDSLVGMIIPPDMPVSAGPGSNTDLPKQKDDWWNAWKNAFGMKLKKSNFHR